MDEQTTTTECVLPEQENAGEERKASITGSNFDELTSEQQDCVRERFAQFFLRIINL